MVTTSKAVAITKGREVRRAMSHSVAARFGLPPNDTLWRVGSPEFEHPASKNSLSAKCLAAVMMAWIEIKAIDNTQGHCDGMDHPRGHYRRIPVLVLNVGLQIETSCEVIIHASAGRVNR